MHIATKPSHALHESFEDEDESELITWRNIINWVTQTAKIEIPTTVHPDRRARSLDQQSALNYSRSSLRW